MPLTFQFLIEFVLSWAYYACALECSEDLRMNPYPQFQIVAAAKTGSTSLYSYLCEHPMIQCAAKKKELNLLRTNSMNVKSEQVAQTLFLSIYFLHSFFSEAFKSVKMVSTRRL